MTTRTSRVALACLVFLTPFLAGQGAPPSDGRGGGTAPPPGRPPEGLLSRTDQKRFTVTWDVMIHATPTTKGESTPIMLDQTAFIFPIIPLSTWSQTDLDSIRMDLRNDTNAVAPSAPMRLDRTAPDGTALAIMPAGSVRGQTVRCTLTQTVTVWRSELDDAAAVKVAWPSEWPAEAKPWLGPDWLIESDDQRFKDFVEKTSQGKLRYTPVFVAAKELLRATINVFRGVDGNGVAVGEQGRVQGLRVDGALYSMQQGHGTAVDLVCACVAVLRAAGIPARPVIGVNEAPTNSNRTVRTTYVVWGEFFLPGSGWVPFDPDMMRGSHAMSASPDRAWTGVGRIKDLNTRVPLAYSLRPRNRGTVPTRYLGAWAWSGQGQIPTSSMREYVSFQMVTTPVGRNSR